MARVERREREERVFCPHLFIGDICTVFPSLLSVPCSPVSQYKSKTTDREVSNISLQCNVLPGKLPRSHDGVYTLCSDVQTYLLPSRHIFDCPLPVSSRGHITLQYFTKLFTLLMIISNTVQHVVCCSVAPHPPK